uniref:Capsid protein n=1 Tax=Giant panda anellovirus TaxID=2016460 RepID=A0A220IGI9_9VIRU|nr:ORF1 [Giant panda anellovirus]
MPWIPRRLWLRRHFGSYRGRPRTFRRSFYYRPWFSRRNRRRYGRRSRIRPRRFRVRTRWMTVRQHNPLQRRRCVIRGWMPALWCDRVTPFMRPMLIGKDTRRAMSGGWTLHELSLLNFYNEHRAHRNLWSQTNCGYDLARYHGTQFTFWPHQTCDYIVWWDADYGDIAEYKKMVKNVHPAILLNRRHVKLILSVETTRRFVPKTILIPPPARVKNEWKTMKEWAKTPLGLFAISVIDFRYPWIHPDFTIYNPIANQEGWTPRDDMYDIKDGTTHDLEARVKHASTKPDINWLWWNAGGDSGSKPATMWVDNWPGWTSESAGRQTMTEREFVAVAMGPFVKKQQVAECQIIATYKSKWTWGGDVLTRDETVCDPETYDPKARLRRDIEDPRYYLEPGDVRKDGFIKPEIWKRLTRSHTRKARFTHYPGESSSEEETDAEIGALPFEEEENDDSSPERPRKYRRGLDGGRIEELQRLRYLLKHIIFNKRSYSV